VKHAYSTISQRDVGGCEDAFKLLRNTKGQPSSSTVAGESCITSSLLKTG